MKLVKGKVRDEKYLAEVRQHGCLVCGNPHVDPHHLMHADDSKEMLRGIGLKNGDDLAVPLCRKHHDELHRFGREQVWWALMGTDPLEWARKNWSKYNDKRNQD